MPPRRRRAPPSPAYAEVRAILLQPWLVDAGHLEGLANQAHERAELTDPFARRSGLILAGHLQYLVIPRHDIGCGASGLHRQMLLVRPCANDARFNLRVLHELAHALLDAHHAQHSHADVWALTLALAVPRCAFRQFSEADHVPRWALALRRQTSRAVARAA